jgi:hypothetical protein
MRFERAIDPRSTPSCMNSRDPSAAVSVHCSPMCRPCCATMKMVTAGFEFYQLLDTRGAP